MGPFGEWRGWLGRSYLEVPSGVMLSLRVLARTGRAGGLRPCARPLPFSGSSHGSVVRAAAAAAHETGVVAHPRTFGPRGRHHVLRALAARKRLAAVYDDEPLDNPYVVHGGGSPPTDFAEILLLVSSRHGPSCQSASAQNAASFFELFVDVSFSCGGWCTRAVPTHLAKRTLRHHRVGFEPQRVIVQEEGMKSPPKFSEKPSEPERSILRITSARPTPRWGTLPSTSSQPELAQRVDASTSWKDNRVATGRLMEVIGKHNDLEGSLGHEQPAGQEIEKELSRTWTRKRSLGLQSRA